MGKDKFLIIKDARPVKGVGVGEKECKNIKIDPSFRITRRVNRLTIFIRLKVLRPTGAI